MRQLLGIALATLALSAPLGCSKSSTSQASSESSSSVFSSVTSFSKSSSGPSAYVRDVRDQTAQWLLAGDDPATRERDLAKIAEKRGISDWEQDEQTYLGIGRGLKKAGVSGNRYESLVQELKGPNPDSAKWIQAGYDAEESP